MTRIESYRSVLPTSYQAALGEDAFSGEDFNETVSVQIVDDWDSVNDDLGDEYEDLREIDLPSYEDDL